MRTPADRVRLAADNTNDHSSRVGDSAFSRPLNAVGDVAPVASGFSRTVAAALVVCALIAPLHAQRGRGGQGGAALNPRAAAPVDLVG
jgi:hypothetical protein